jgi:hypothetical protein
MGPNPKYIYLLSLPPLPEKKPASQTWATFTYTGKETTSITKLFKHTNIRIAYRTTSNLLHLLTPNSQPPDPLTHLGVYRLSCPDCNKAYIGQTGRNCQTRYEEHRRAFHYNNPSSKYALHALTRQHAFGNIKDSFQILHNQKKGALLNTIERFRIFKEASTHNDTHTVPSSSIFQAILDDFTETNK